MEPKDTPIYQRAQSVLPDYYDLDFQFGLLFKFPENEWFDPSNREDESFSVCEEFSRLNFICKRVTPIWNNSSFYGQRISFMYNKRLKYEKETT